MPDYGLPPILTSEEVADFLRICTETVHPTTRSGERRPVPGLCVKRYLGAGALKLVGLEVA